MIRRGFRFLLLAVAILGLPVIAYLWSATVRETWVKNWRWGENSVAIRSDIGRLCIERVKTSANAKAVQGSWYLEFADGGVEGLIIVSEPRLLRNGYGFNFWAWTSPTFGSNPRGSMWGFTTPRHLPSTRSVWASSHRASFWRLTIPHWALMAICLFPIAFELRRFLINRRTRSRLNTGLCTACGYDLRATPERCPECGEVAKV